MNRLGCAAIFGLQDAYATSRPLIERAGRILVQSQQ